MTATSPRPIEWHALSAEAACTHLGVEPNLGLSDTECQTRLEQFGFNRIQEKSGRPVWRILLDQFTDFMVLVLIAAAIVSGFVGEAADSIAIVVIVLLNALIGFVQEFRAQRAVAALKKMAATEVRVRREGQSLTIPADMLVPGDIVLIEAGNIIPADLRLIQVAGLKVTEAALTGESVAVNKITAPLSTETQALGDRINLTFKGTLVASGRAEGVVYATGMETELGKIASLLSRDDFTKTPLQKRLAMFGKRLALSILAICVVIFTAGVLRGEPVILMLLTSVSLAVAAIPEALPAVVTVSLAFGARKMVKHQALIRRLPAVETLGSVTTICSDKTGTLTRNVMNAEIFSADGRLLRQLPLLNEAQGSWKILAEALSLNNDTETDKQGRTIGEPTEVALHRAAEQSGFIKAELIRSAPRIAEIPFDSERKRMTTFHEQDEVLIAFTKGAPETVLERCTHTLTSEGRVEIDIPRLLAHAEILAAKGFRVLAFACREWNDLPGKMESDSVEQGLDLLGMVGLIDPPRPEAKSSVRQCRQSGIRPVMITGDHPSTAIAIAARLGIAAINDPVATGEQLSHMNDEEFDALIPHTNVFARVNPDQKIRIVRSLQQQGQFVAMTGDGVNDAPALKQADIGVAMGQKGTDVAREASDMILLDDNFATIVSAVREGRHIYDNIRKFVKYTMTSNSGEIWTLFLAPFLGLPIPLLPIHILWINLVTDGLPGLALTVEKEERGLMQRPPRPPDESVFAHGMWQHILVIGLLIGGLSLYAQIWAIQRGSEHWRTMVFMVLTLAQLVNVMAIRSERESLLSIGICSNRPLLAAILVTLGLQLAIVYTPFLNIIFKTAPLNEEELTFCLLIPMTVLFVVEIEKFMARRGWIYKNSGSRSRTENHRPA